MTRGTFRIARTKDRSGCFTVPGDLHSAVVELDRMLPVGARYRYFLAGKYLPVAEHYGLGMWIRNWWGLWSGQVDRRPGRRQDRKGLSNTIHRSQLQQYFIDRGVTDPDAMSGILLSIYAKHLRGFRRIQEPKISESEKKRRTHISRLKAYWTRLHALLQQQDCHQPPFACQPNYGKANRWVSYSIGKGTAILSAACLPNRRLIRAALFLRGCCAKPIFQALRDSNAFAETDAPESVQWLPNEDGRRFEIRLEYDADPMDYSDRDRQHRWLADRLMGLQAAFRDRELDGM